MDIHLKEVFTRFNLQFGSGPGMGPGSSACLLKVDGISPSFIKSLFKASAALYRTDPWKRLRPSHLFGIRVGKNSDWGSKRQPFTCIQFIGGDGGDLGFNMFRSESDAIKMTGSRETIRVPNVELLRVTYQAEGLMFPANRRMIRTLGLESSGDADQFPCVDVVKCGSSGGLQFRNATLEELRFAYAFMKAITLLHPLLQEDKDAKPKWSRLVGFEPFIETVDVQWPAEMVRGWDLVAVTVSYPPGQGYEEKEKEKVSSNSSTPTKNAQVHREDFVDVSDVGVRQCTLCEKEVNAEQSVCCVQCLAVVYCGAVCQKQHWKEMHKSSCGLYKAMMEREEELAMEIFMFPCTVESPCSWLESLGLHQKGMWRRMCNCYLHCSFGLLPNKGGLSELWGGLDDEEFPSDLPFPKHLRDGISNPILLSSWSEYYNMRTLPLSSPVAAILSYSLTVYYITMSLNISSKSLLLNGGEVIVHYLGPEMELDWMQAFAEIGHLLNGLGNMQIIMVGPEVPTNLSGTVLGIGSRVRVNLIRGIYQEEATYLPSPHLIVSLNSGLDKYASWGGALDLIKAMNIPAFFTDHSEVSCGNNKQVLRGAGLHITHPVTPNPFRSPVKNRGASNNLPSYSNAFLLGVNT